MFFADPKLDSRYNLYLEFYKTQFFADPKLDSHYNLYLEFDKTMIFADPNLDSRSRAVPGGGHRAMPPPQSAKILKQIWPHFGQHPAPRQYAALPNQKSWNRPWLSSKTQFS